MLDHISLGVTDLDRSIAFYDAVLAPLGYRRLWHDSDAAGYGLQGRDEPFAIKQDRAGGAPGSPRAHVAFQASNRSAVVAFYESALLAGAVPDGKPELHPMYGDGYFAAFVSDPDGHRLEAVCHEARENARFAVDHVQLAMPAGGETAARSFYVDVLGFEEIPKPPELAKRGGAWFGAGSVRIHLGVDPDFVPAKKAHVALRCGGYDELAARFAAAGKTPLDDPLPFQGKRHCYVFDPFGNRVEIIEA